MDIDAPDDLRTRALRLAGTALQPLGRVLRHRHSDESWSLSHRRAWADAPRLEVRSASFAAGGEIPDRCCGLGIGDNVSPDLHWSTVPHGTQALLLVLEDVDALSPRPRVHTAAVLDPHVVGFREAGPRPDTEVPGVQFLTVGGRVGYHGPRPLPGHGRHRYRFHVAALSRRPDAGSDTSLDQVLLDTDALVLAAGMLEGHRSA